MKRIIPLVLAIISVVIFSGLIFKNEHHLNNSESMYVRLQPVDPRSLIQGDYMVLNYQLYFAPQNVERDAVATSAVNEKEHIFSGNYFDELIKNKSSVLVYVELDQQKRVIHTYFNAHKNVQTSKLILQNPNNQHMSLYPASQSFLFAEGLAECYQASQYAEFKVDKQGNAILATLRGEHLQDLDCEAKHHWWNGLVPKNTNTNH